MCETDGHKIKEECKSVKPLALTPGLGKSRLPFSLADRANFLNAVRAVTPVPLDDYFDVPRTIDCRRNRNFYGRKLALERLLTLVRPGGRSDAGSAIAVVTGTRGIGKTELVREYVYRHQDAFQPILWIDAQTLQSVQAAFLDFAQKMVDLYAKKSDPQPSIYRAISRHLGMENFIDEEGKIRLGQRSPDPIVNAVKEWFGRKGNENWLIIADNVDDIEVSKVADFMPSTLLGHIILISRRRELASLGKELRVEVMSKEESLNLFRQSCGKEFKEETHEGLLAKTSPNRRTVLTSTAVFEQARRIVHKLHYQTSTIVQAANYITETGLPIDAFERSLDAGLEDVLIDTPEFPTGLESDGQQTSEALGAIFNTLEQDHATAVDLLNLCSFMHGDSIPLKMFSWGFNFDGKDGKPDVLHEIS
jgi:hypothetical protein